ncbi:PH domain-containing protein [Streptomyces litchfieldiae]|uniref:PH domain-containing protein n=1 Tax=Streptomyces litchfieldiae TaxID=3075543 RepID=A0ABU2MPV7_9ACTN|nr:PH domain-containing protein [Streptomyces sp. DSM 44938]MDT0343639.1 PH domain-containing protein [Streptomyces sp. DSM 44938]
MSDVREVTCRPFWERTLWFFVVLGAAGAGLAVVRVANRGELLDVWLGVGLLLALMGLAALRGVAARVSADARGLHVRTLPRRRSVPWPDIADLRVHVRVHRSQETRRVGLVLRDGRKRLLPLPHSGWSAADPDFDAKLNALRALHRRYGAPESSHVPVVTYRTAGYGRAGTLALCVLLLGGAGGAAWLVPNVASDERAWQSAGPCAAETPAGELGECLTTLSAVIARTEAAPSNRARRSSWLYFTDGRPLERVAVSREAAQSFRPGDTVELTVWRGDVREVAGERHVWREHVPGAGEVAVIAAALALAAGYPGALVLLRLRGRRLPADEVVPSALPFAGALAGTALWLLPLCYLHPTTLLTSPQPIAWAAAGSLATLGLFVRAWRATRVRTPGEGGATGKSMGEEGEGEVFLAARFLEHTDYNPYGFGTHIVLGSGPPAVVPHSGPGRFAAKRIPVERLGVRNVRRARGSDGDTVPRSWHIAELDDAGKQIRLAAAPADLTRIIRELETTKIPAHTADREP